MDDFKEMYHRLFNTMTDVINELQTVQKETEELYISQESTQPVLQILDSNKHTD